MPALHHYRVYGWHLASALPLPGLVVAESGAPVDLTIRRAPVPAELPDPDLDGPVLQAKFKGDWLWRVPGGPRFCLRPDAEIHVDTLLPDDAPDLATFLLGPVLGLWAHRAGRLPLHATTVEIDGHAIALAGSSGAGKSTLAAALLATGARLITDDISLVRFADDGVWIDPGPARLKLWRRTLDALALPVGLRIRSVEIEKFYHPVAATNAPARLQALVILGVGDKISYQRLSGFEALAGARDQTYRWRAGQQLGFTEQIFRHAGRFAERVPISVLTRVEGFDELPHLIARLRQELVR